MGQSPPPHAEIVTILFTDLVDSTQLFASLGDDAAQVLRRDHFNLLRGSVHAHGGREVKNLGDGLMVVFPSAREALAAAAQIAVAVAARNEQASGPPLGIRMGMHAGEPIREDADFFGMAVTIAKRLCDAATEGQILASALVTGLVGSRGAVKTRPVGALTLKGVPEPIPAEEVLWEHRTENDPASDPPPPAPGPAGLPKASRVVRAATLAVPIDAFVGREADLALLGTLLGEARLVTVLGPGGVGKTRLSLQAVDTLAERFPDGLWCVDLAALDSDGRVAEAVASTLRVDERAGLSTVERVVEFLAGRRALLYLDNCEHVIDGAAHVAQALLAGAPDVRILASSREPLGLAGEQRLPLAPLPVPADVDADAPAVRLFVRRAAAADPGFAVASDNLAAVCELCRYVDGHPLALELAAARLAACSVTEVVAEVRDRLVELGGGGRGRVPRHRSTSALVGWSYDLLDPADRRVLARMAVFAGGATVEAADAVCADRPGGRVRETLVGLVDRSLVVGRRERDATRYAMLAPIRAFAAERLTEVEDPAGVRDRHAEYYLDFAEAADRGLRGPEEPVWVARLDAELANLRCAQDWLIESGDADRALRLIAALFWYGYFHATSAVFGWAERAAQRFAAAEHPRLPTVYALAAVGAWRRGDLPRCTEWAEFGVAAAAGDPATGRLALAALGDAHGFAGRFDESLAHFLAAVELSRQVGDDLHVAQDTGSAALVAAYGGDTATANALVEQAGAAAARCGSPSASASADYTAGEVLLDLDPARALPLLERARAKAAAVPSPFMKGVAGLSAISAQARCGDPQHALPHYPDLIEHWSRAGAWTQQWVTVRTLIEALAAVGRDEPAAVLHGALDASPTATPVTGADAARLERVLEGLADRLGTEGLVAARAHGAALGDPGAIAFALDTLRAQRA